MNSSDLWISAGRSCIAGTADTVLLGGRVDVMELWAEWDDLINGDKMELALNKNQCMTRSEEHIINTVREGAQHIVRSS